MHDIAHHIENLLTELPIHREDEKCKKKLLEEASLTSGRKETKRAVDFRCPLITTSLYVQGTASLRVQSILNIMVDMQDILYNSSFLTGIVPDKFKMARVIPIFKKGSQTSLNNYRPISLLSVFNKLLEKLMYKRVIDFFNKRQVIYSKQFGFRSHYSTEYAVLSIIDQVQLAIESHDYSWEYF